MVEVKKVEVGRYARYDEKTGISWNMIVTRKGFGVFYDGQLINSYKTKTAAVSGMERFKKELEKNN